MYPLRTSDLRIYNRHNPTISFLPRSSRISFQHRERLRIAVAPVPEIQILSKQGYTKQHLVRLPNAYPLPSLAPDSIRVQISLFSLSTSNSSYAA